MNAHLTCIPTGPAELWSRICALVSDAARARRNGLGARNHAEEITAVKAEQRATDELVSELDQLAQQGVLDEISSCLSVIYGRAEGI